MRAAAGRRGWLRIRPTGPVVALNSAAEKGRANRELIQFLAEFLDLPPSSISLIKGNTSRNKVIRIETLSPQTAAAKLLALEQQVRRSCL